MKKTKKDTSQTGKAITSESIKNLLSKVEGNALSDRQRLLGLVADLEGEIEDKDSHLAYGGVVSKYLDGATRSNEQLMKVASLRHKILMDGNEKGKRTVSIQDIEDAMEHSKGAFDS